MPGEPTGAEVPISLPKKKTARVPLPPTQQALTEAAKDAGATTAQALITGASAAEHSTGGPLHDQHED